MNTLSRTRRLGGSLIVALPRALVEKEGLQVDQIVLIDVKKVKKSGFGIMRGLPSFSADTKLRGQLDDDVRN
jgi:hypothetical protein